MLVSCFRGQPTREEEEKSRPGKKKKKGDQDRGRKKPTRIVKKPTRIGPFLGGALASFGDERYEWKDE